MRRGAILTLFAVLGAPAAAQVALPDLAPATGIVRGALDAVAPVTRTVTNLVDVRLDRLTTLLRENRATIERDDSGYPSRRGELLLLDPDRSALDIALGRGFSLIEQGRIDGLDVAFARLSTPQGMTLARAIRQLRKALPGKEITADQIFLEAGMANAERGASSGASASGGTVGLIDGGVGGGIAIAQVRGFATGAPLANAHGTAIASLLHKTGAARIVSADVYGRDPAGGNALAIARALGWMTALRVPVVSISLVGPANPLLARTIAAAHARGVIIVAAVGNDGPAAPPAYPASYPSVVAVTGVDKRNRALIEAGRALHLDYAAPGADLAATGLDGRRVTLRGTSFAAPLVAARLAASYASAPNRAALLARLDATAIDLGAKGPDKIYGRGLICGECR